MMQNIYTVRDSKAEAFLTPWFMANDQMAIRTFATSVNDQNHMFHHNPEDFTLVRLGTYDDASGVIEPEIEAVHSAQELIR